MDVVYSDESMNGLNQSFFRGEGSGWGRKCQTEEKTKGFNQNLPDNTGDLLFRLTSPRRLKSLPRLIWDQTVFIWWWLKIIMAT